MLFETAKFAQKSGFSVDKWVVEQISSIKGLSRRKLGALIRKLKKVTFLHFSVFFFLRNPS